MYYIIQSTESGVDIQEVSPEKLDETLLEIAEEDADLVSSARTHWADTVEDAMSSLNEGRVNGKLLICGKIVPVRIIPKGLTYEAIN